MAIDKERGFKKLDYVDDALKKILSFINPVDSEVIMTRDAMGRVLVDDIVAPIDYPPFDRAAMDGYAVDAKFVSSASPNNPVRLKIVGEAKTAKPFTGKVGPYETVRIDTGAPLPSDTNAVVMVEDTVKSGDYVDIYSSISPYQNVSIKGEDVKKGDTVVYGGVPLTSMDLASLINLDIFEVKVYRKVRVSIASIGSELKEENEALDIGQIRETNRILVSGILSWLPIEVVRKVILPDDVDVIKNYIYESVDDSDIVVTTGGTSLGMGDYVTDIAKDLGTVITHGVALQPAKPVLTAIVKGKPFIGLPGYPVAAAISTDVFLVPIIMKLAGIKGSLFPSKVKARLVKRVASRLGYRQYVRVKIVNRDGELIAVPIWASGAGVVSSLSRADGYLIIPENVEGYEEGEVIEVYLFRRVLSL